MPLLLFCSFLSGAAALVDQVVWTNLLALAFGGTRVASGAVLAGFLGGLGIGAYVIPASLPRRFDPLRAYVIVELGIAVSAVAVTLYIPHLPQHFAELVPAAAGTTPASVFLRFVTAACLLLAPTMLMGATLPLLASSVIRDEAGLNRHLARLYGFNTLGAAAGALIAGLLLIEAFGHRGSVFLAAGLNVIVALLVLGGARRDQIAAPMIEPAASGAGPKFSRRAAGLVLAISGAATITAEVIWFRAFSYLFGTSLYAFTLTLTTFLIGLGLGPIAFRRFLERKDPVRALTIIQLGIGLSSLLVSGLVTYAVSSPALVNALSIFSHEARSLAWGERLLRDGIFALGVALPATTLMGLSFPLAARLYVGDARHIAARFGSAILLSNVGCIAGAVIGSLMVLPALGTVLGARCVACVHLAMGASIAFWGGLRWARFAAVFAAGALALLIWIVAPDRVRFAAAVAPKNPVKLVFEEEGDLSTVQVWRNLHDDASLGMAIDGTIIGASQAWGTETYSKQILIAHLPFALESRIRDVLTIGLGSATTLEAIAGHENVRTVDVVEINEPVARAARLFPSASALNDPRVELIVDDALHFLRFSRKHYDAIVSDGKCSMLYSGTSKLLTREYYDLCKASVGEWGIFVQWVPIGIAESEVRSIIRTLGGSFPEIGLFMDPPEHLLFVASRAPFAGRPRPTPAEFGASRAGKDLAGIGINDWEELVGRWVAGARALKTCAGAGPMHTWDSPSLEFSAYRLPPSARGAETARTYALVGRAAALDAGSSEALELAGSEQAATLAAQRADLEMIHRALIPMEKQPSSR